MHRLRSKTSIATLCWFAAVADTALAADGHVVDINGKPAVGVWVVGQWETGGGFVHGGGGCIAVVTRTNEKGEFTLSGGLFGPRSHGVPYFYAPGYRLENKPKNGQETKVPFVMVSDTQIALERLKNIHNVVKRTDCGIDYVVEHRDQFLPFYRAASEEAREIAKSKRERSFAFLIWQWLYRAEFGSEEADRRIHAEGAAIQRELE